MVYDTITGTIKRGHFMKETNIKNFGNIFLELRNRKGLTQTEVADIVTAETSLISYYEKNKRVPPLEKFIKMCDFYGITDHIPLFIKVSNDMEKRFVITKDGYYFADGTNGYVKSLFDNRLGLFDETSCKNFVANDDKIKFYDIFDVIGEANA